MQRTLAWHPATRHTASRQNQTWRIGAKPGSRLQPRDRRERDTVFSPPFPEMVKPGQRPEDIVGIKQLIDAADLVIEPEKERILLDGPLPGSFRPFSFHESVDIYVAQNDAGQLNLAQTYLYDRDAQAYAKPCCDENVPDAFQHYQVLPWDTWISAETPDTEEEEQHQLHKVFFVRQTPLHGGRSSPRMHFEEVYCIDGNDRSVEKSQVQDLRDDSTIDPVLSIRDGELMIQDTRDCPTMEGYAQIYDILETLEDYMATQKELKDDEVAFEEEIDSYIDEQPDIPDSDML